MDKCPRCGAELEFDEVDIGVGIQRGNPGCPECHWVPEARPLNVREEEARRDADFGPLDPTPREPKAWEFPE